MIKLENFEVIGWEHVVRGMRNPMNSWDKSDSTYCGDHETCYDCPAYKLDENDMDNNTPNYLCTAYQGELPGDPIIIGENDHNLMMKLAKGGSVHAKYRRMITVYVDITAPLYWWKEFDTYKVGTVANSCSTMHKIHEKEFTLDDFSCEHLCRNSLDILEDTITVLNINRFYYTSDEKLKGDKGVWWQMIQLLPSSYNQKRTVMLNYEVLTNIYRWRKDHKLDEWREFCKWIEELPYSEVITGEVKKDEI